VDELALPFAFHVLVLDEVGLSAHPQLLEHACGRRVPSLQPADDPVEPQVFEGQPEQDAGGLRPVSATVVVGMDDEPDLARRCSSLRKVRVQSPMSSVVAFSTTASERESPSEPIRLALAFFSRTTRTSSRVRGSQ
jgi:hypothetical protein